MLSKKIYILDDDLDFLDMLHHILGKNYEVKATTSIKMEELEAFKPDLVLMDNDLGNINSYTMVNDIHDNIPGFAAPVILITGHHDISLIEKHDSVKGIIQKPASVKDIRSFIDEFLGIAV